MCQRMHNFKVGVLNYDNCGISKPNKDNKGCGKEFYIFPFFIILIYIPLMRGQTLKRKRIDTKMIISSLNSPPHPLGPVMH